MSKKSHKISQSDSKLSHKKSKSLTNWQCFQKDIIPKLEGDRGIRNQEAAKLWNTKSFDQKQKYDCSDIDQKIELHRNKDQDKLYEMIGKIEQALNYTIDIPELDFSSVTTNYDLLRNLLDESEIMMKQKKYQKLEIFNKFKEKIDEINQKLNDKEEDNEESASNLDFELLNINQSIEKINFLIRKSENDNIEGNNNEIINKAKIRVEHLKKLNNIYEKCKNYKELSKKDYILNFKEIKNLVKFFNNIDVDKDILNCYLYLRVNNLYEEMNLYKKNIMDKSFHNIDIISKDIKIIN